MCLPTQSLQDIELIRLELLLGFFTGEYKPGKAVEKGTRFDSETGQGKFCKFLEPISTFSGEQWSESVLSCSTIAIANSTKPLLERFVFPGLGENRTCRERAQPFARRSESSSRLIKITGTRSQN